MNVVVQGAGVIGRATARLLGTLGHVVTLHDPALGYQAMPSEVCVVVTPCLDGYLDDPGWAKRSDRVVVRSTVIPDAFDALTPGARYHWPEFASDATIDEEIANPDKLVWGADNPADGFVFDFLGPHAARLAGRTACMSLRASCLVKLGINALYVSKLLMFNALADLAEHDYADVRGAIGLDQRITLSHADPWQGGYRGAGGKCLVKDTTNLAAITDGWAGDFLAGLLKANRELRGQ